MARPTLTDVPGIGEYSAEQLANGGIRTVNALAKASPEKIAGIPGFGPVRAARLRAAAEALSGPDPSVAKTKPRGKKKKAVAKKEPPVPSKTSTKKKSKPKKKDTATKVSGKKKAGKKEKSKKAGKAITKKKAGGKKKKSKK